MTPSDATAPPHPALETPDGAVKAAGTCLAQVAWDLGRGTQVRIREIGEVVDTPRGDGLMSVDYVFVRRGRLSRLAIKKFLQRLLVGSLVCKMVETAPDHVWRRRAARERVWLDRHLKIASGQEVPCA